MMYSALDYRYMHRALDLAAWAARMNEVPIAAVLVDENGLQAESWNQPICCHDPTAHAEVMVLRQAGKRLRNYRLLNTTLYVTLEPCAMCVGAIIHARVSRVVFAASDLKSGAVGGSFLLPDMAKFNHQLQWQGGLLADEAGKLLRDFFHLRRKTSLIFD